MYEYFHFPLVYLGLDASLRDRRDTAAGGTTGSPFPQRFRGGRGYGREEADGSERKVTEDVNKCRESSSKSM